MADYKKFLGKQTATLDEVEPERRTVEKFKAEPNHKYRIGFPLLNENGKVRIDRVFYFNRFDDNFKGKFIVPEDCDEETFGKFIEVLGEPIYRYVTTIVVYGTEKDGRLIKPINFKVLPFVFADGILADLKAINEEFPLAEHDLLVSLKEGTDPKYQNLTILPTNKEAVWRHEKLKDAIQAQVQEVAKDMHKAVATETSCANLRSILVNAGLLASPSTPKPEEASGSTVTDVDIDDLDDI